MARNAEKMRPIDRLLSLFGVPTATRHDKAVASAEAAIGTTIEVRTQAEALTDAIRQLNATLDRGD